MPHPTIKPEIAYVYASAEIIRLSCLLSIPTARIAPYCLIRADTLMDILLTILNSEIIPIITKNQSHRFKSTRKCICVTMAFFLCRRAAE